MVTRKSVYGTLGLAISLGVIVIFGGIKEVSARVSVSVDLNLGSSPPQEVIMVPENSVYFVPDQGIDVFFYSGFWWATRDNQWYRSNDYNGTWVVIDRRYVPSPVHHVYEVPNYREVYVRQVGRHIPYGQWKENGHREIAQVNRQDKEDHKKQGNKKQGHGK